MITMNIRRYFFMQKNVFHNLKNLVCKLLCTTFV